MRTARLRYDREACYYHLMNRVAGSPSELPFGDAEKEYFYGLARRLATFYTLDVLSLVVLGNHWHLVCSAPAEVPCAAEISRRFRAFYGPRRFEPDWDRDVAARTRYGARMRDISHFAKDLQQMFSGWFNRTRPGGRRGRLWAERFKSVILDGRNAVWECVKYVEMNPVRAKLCSDPADYRFGTWGRLCGSGHHPFGDAFCRHLRRLLGERVRECTDGQVVIELRAELARVSAAERGESSERIFAAVQRARGRQPACLTLTRRVRYWSDGAIIGSQQFVRSLTAELLGAERARRKRYDSAVCASGTGLVSFRQLRTPA